MSMKIDRVKDDKLSWSAMYGDPGTAQYHNLEDEVNYAVRHLSNNVSNFSWLSLIFPWVSAEAENTSQSPLLFKTGHIKTFLLCPSFRILLLYQSPQKRENEIQGVSTHDASEAEFERYWLFLLIKKTRLEWGHKRRETENKDFVPIFNLSLPYLTSQDESTA